MAWKRRARGAGAQWWIGVAAGGALAGGVFLWRFLRGPRAPRPPRRAGKRAAALETAVVEALRRDPELGHRPIEVTAIADGIVELSGRVATEEEADRAVAVARSVAGTGTVLNRLDSDAVASHLAGNRRRFLAGDPSLAETHWYGQGVGTGRRRQGRETDPERRDDRVELLSRELGADRAVELASERLDKIPPGVEGHTTRPAAPLDRGRVDDASHRRLGNVPEHPIQDLNPGAGLAGQP